MSSRPTLPDGWFVIVPRADFEDARRAIAQHAEAAGRDPSAIGTEPAVGVVGRPSDEWLAEVREWEQAGVTHLCLRTLGGNLDARGHLAALREAHAALEAR